MNFRKLKKKFYDPFEIVKERTVNKRIKKEKKTYFNFYLEEKRMLTESQKKIAEICDGMKDLLLYKNQKYGDSALNPKNIFYKGDATNSIKIRLDDKIGRVRNCEETRVNDVCDIIGYCVLLLASMDVSEHEINNLKD